MSFSVEGNETKAAVEIAEAPRVRLFPVPLRPPWPAGMWGYLERIAQRSSGRYLACDLAALVSGNRVAAWLVLVDAVDRGLILTEILIYPQLKAVRVFGLAGDGMEDWLDAAEAEITAFGESRGCSRLEAGGRSGWERVLPHWRKIGVEMERGIA